MSRNSLVVVLAPFEKGLLGYLKHDTVVKELKLLFLSNALF